MVVVEVLEDGLGLFKFLVLNYVLLLYILVLEYAVDDGLDTCFDSLDCIQADKIVIFGVQLGRPHIFFCIVIIFLSNVLI